MYDGYQIFFSRKGFANLKNPVFWLYMKMSQRTAFYTAFKIYL